MDNGKPSHQTRRASARSRAWAITAIGACFPLAAAAAPTFVVNNPFDVGAGGDLTNGICQTAADNTVCTLRAAIMKANRYPGGGVTINIIAGTFKPDFNGVAPTADGSGNFNISQSMKIAGAGINSTFIDGSVIQNVFHAEQFGITLELADLTIQNATANAVQSSNGGLKLDRVRLTNNKGTFGGATNIVAGSATINDSMFDRNESIFVAGTPESGSGGAARVYNSTVTFNRVSMIDNISENYGGAVVAIGVGGAPPGAVTFNDSALTGNRSGVGGAASLQDSASVVVNRSLVASNYVIGNGGAFTLGGGSSVVLNNSTISANVAQIEGGAFYNFGTVTAFHVTIAGNISLFGGGGIHQNGSGFSIGNSIITENYAVATPADCSGPGPITSQDYNYIKAACPIGGTITHHITGGDVRLDSLRNNGGATATHALLAGSPAIDKVPTGLCRDSLAVVPTTDQRNIQRPAGAACDMGAFEGTASSSLYNRNLIRNGNAEDGGGTRTGAIVALPYWTKSIGQATAIRYGAPGGYPTAGVDAIPVVHGYNFFGGGNDVSSSASQAIDIPATDIARIDTGQVRYRLSGDFGGFLTDNDAASLTLTFHDVNNAVVGTQKTIGNVTAAQRNNLTGFLAASATGNIPAGTRKLVVTLNFVRAAGNSNDGYADNLSLILDPASLDIDGNGSFDALTDGILIIRYLFSIRDASLITGALGSMPTRSTAADITQYLDSIKPSLDVDANNVSDALTDGILIIRYLFSLRDQSLVTGAIGNGAMRANPTDIAAYLQTLAQ